MTAAENSPWQESFQEHGSSILAFLTSRLGRRDLAEDLLQETFVRAMRRSPDLPDSRSTKSYLFTTAHRLVLDQRRRKRVSLFSEVGRADSRPVEEDLVDTESPSPERSADLSRFGETLREILRDLRPAHRTAFESAVLQQKAYAEVASEQGWSLEQVKINVFRARKTVMLRLRETLGPVAEM